MTKHRFLASAIFDVLGKMKPGEQIHVMHEGEIVGTITRDEELPGNSTPPGPDEVPGKTST